MSIDLYQFIYQKYKCAQMLLNSDGGSGISQGMYEISESIDDNLRFTVAADSSYTFSGVVYTDGYATAEVSTAPH